MLPKVINALKYHTGITGRYRPRARGSGKTRAEGLKARIITDSTGNAARTKPEIVLKDDLIEGVIEFIYKTLKLEILMNGRYLFQRLMIL